ncbi:tRNA (adenosine(37)-N6)-threonylcarbamoyltransferase complex ATPase subunit type 1 TsaE [Spiroplasma poulsonii]|uniref:tRNA threonylcarbamoyladenosine biosynthesis protein TsaE n=1 Tax=Spiroplasma poulsonii TaxID=2138 RepID=A0A2P6FE29_9MOLU|nr:tRNA (adenosine(37)-N6)-threonylcarbamoyltransferase complex ATPase subunit type 1 TsaE [Spiroplasma poulsonii]KAF0850706.1 tRNA threonylcarbamoyladenosine biosynthesis protein TsaE [Spiroplasma poulsonii]PQM31716.1 tRNA threonylcarbamoyladenosine biosynthesis protein TsaE [Spiroplasma poulsonii]PWF96747.1 tRNA threonylcarbamoyladenosine biosynthesis protein TsaE [Spiroplasma poulsonii]PWF97322.1 tRNA threonylcarbamoyladenosine biosynthesis protein TsaE [Spiroplasma poulsonii]
MKIMISDENATKQLATKIAPFLQPNWCLLLEGQLAAGKTTFTKYLLAALGVTKPVTSPSFIIMNKYTTPDQTLINHMDCYRLLGLDHSEEWGMYFDYFPNSINIIEWPSLISKDLTDQYEIIKITINIEKDQERVFTIKTNNVALRIALESGG